MKVNEKLAPYLPGIIALVLLLIVGMATYKDYGMAWDEPAQRGPGLLSFNYIYHGSQELFLTPSDNHGAGYELLLIFIEKGLRLKDPKAIYEMRHIVTNVFFLFSAFFAYILILRLFKDKWLALLGFLMIVLNPRLYGHSFFNSKDMPFLCMVIVMLALCQMAFERQKKWLFLLLGIAAGYATSIRIMGVMHFLIILGFLVIDMLADMKKKEKPAKQLIHIGLFMLGFCSLLYMSWPYIWRSPIKKFGESFTKMASFDWHVSVLFQGKAINSTQIPWNYFPVWFTISNPLLWLIAGFAGVVLIAYFFIKKPLTYFQNTQERNYVLYLATFLAPIFAVIILHSVIYDDWRHLYFVYPPFVFMAIYAIHMLWKGKAKIVLQVACGLQLASLIFFMVRNHPFPQVYFNPLVSHEEEYLRRNYDFEYWACGYKQGLDYIIANDTSHHIKICCEHKTPLDNNILMLPASERDRFVWTTSAPDADYFITNFRLHPTDYPDDAHPSPNIEYEIQAENSTLMRLYTPRGKRGAILK